MATIVILEHELQQYVELPYMMRTFAEHWRACGHQVHLHHGLGEPPPGDLAILHVDLTVVPPAYLQLLRRFPRTVNAAVADVSKRRFSADLLDRYSDWIGPVIVKTDRNFGGKPEQLLRAVGARAGGAMDIDEGAVAESYPVYESLRRVPPAVWGDPGLIVERFLPERDGEEYALRVWTVLGDRDRSVRWRAREPIVKAGNMIGRDEVEVPAALREWRRRLGFDFGKFDYVRHGERWVLLDVNRTPSYPRQSRGPDPLAALAEGVESYLR